jgi:hypothetical protein
LFAIQKADVLAWSVITPCPAAVNDHLRHSKNNSVNKHSGLDHRFGHFGANTRFAPTEIAGLARRGDPCDRPFWPGF